MAKTMAVIAIKQKLFVWKITFWLFFFFYFVRDVKSAHSKSQFIQACSSIIIHHTLIHCETNWINWFGGLFFIFLCIQWVMLLSLTASSSTKVRRKNEHAWLIDKESAQQTISIPTKSLELNKRASLLIYLSLNLIFNSLIE